MIASQNRTWAAAADYFARNVDEPLMTLLGAAHSLARDPSSPEAHRLAESAARNASRLAAMVSDLQRIARRATMPARREMIEVMPALRDALGAGNVRIEGDESLVAIAAPADLTAFVDYVVAFAEGKTVGVSARTDGDVVRVTVRIAFCDRPVDASLIRTLAEPLGPVSVGIDGTITVSLPALPTTVAAAAPRWQPRIEPFSGLASR